MSGFFRKLRWLTERDRKEAELREELEFHLEEEAQECHAQGLGEEEARWVARRDLGNLALVQEDTSGSDGRRAACSRRPARASAAHARCAARRSRLRFRAASQAIARSGDHALPGAAPHASRQRSGRLALGHRAHDGVAPSLSSPQRALRTSCRRSSSLSLPRVHLDLLELPQSPADTVLKRALKNLRQKSRGVITEPTLGGAAAPTDALFGWQPVNHRRSGGGTAVVSSSRSMSIATWSSSGRYMSTNLRPHKTSLLS
jgi:hypothetical protein